MPLPGFIASFFVTRSVPVIASAVLHASVVAGLVVAASGHGAGASVSVPWAQVELDVDATESALLAAELPPPRAAPKNARDLAAPSHSHPYPVDPAHEAHPHDPAHHHDEARAAPAAPVRAAEQAPSAPDHGARAAAPALTATGASVPRFTIASGSGAPLGVRVAVDGNGSGSATSATSAGGADDATMPASSVHVGARLAQSVVAAYPVHARADEVEGDVAVEIVVDREGRVIEARVTRPAGHGFDEAALVAVRSYRFSPAQREGRAVRVRMAWSVQFRLR